MDYTVLTQSLELVKKGNVELKYYYFSQDADPEKNA